MLEKCQEKKTEGGKVLGWEEDKMIYAWTYGGFRILTSSSSLPDLLGGTISSWTPPRLAHFLLGLVQWFRRFSVCLSFPSDNTGMAYFIGLHFIVHCRHWSFLFFFFFFYKLKACGNCTLRKSIGAIFPTAQLVSILVILVILQKFSLLLYSLCQLVISDLWCYWCKFSGILRTGSVFKPLEYWDYFLFTFCILSYSKPLFCILSYTSMVAQR